MNSEENKIKIYSELTDEELLSLKEELESEIAYYEDELADNSVDSIQKSEITNSDMPYAKERLEAVESIIRDRGLINTK